MTREEAKLALLVGARLSHPVYNVTKYVEQQENTVINHTGDFILNKRTIKQFWNVHSMNKWNTGWYTVKPEDQKLS